ncbi:hypothetical protein [Nocardia sp. NPDC056000]|uniref:hypothetical protein n=1 Tax=Nocardia sp. NPDC056000 TaxID=3345674 RepID=UPI0035D60AE1
MDSKIDAAHRALHAVIVQGRQAGDFARDEHSVGVLNAFFRNVMERPFSGHENNAQVIAYLEGLRRAYPRQLSTMNPVAMAPFVLEQIGPGAPRPGRSRWTWTSALVLQMRLLAECTAKREGIVGQDLETYLLGACARYQSFDF